MRAEIIVFSRSVSEIYSVTVDVKDTCYISVVGIYEIAVNKEISGIIIVVGCLGRIRGIPDIIPFLLERRICNYCLIDQSVITDGSSDTENG